MICFAISLIEEMIASKAWFDRVAPTLTFVIVLFGYVQTIMPSIPGGDSGELVAEACELGTAHPPGYPLYTLLLHLVTLVPYGSIAWRANLFCSTLSAIASGFLCALVQQFSKGDLARHYTWGGIVAGSMYGFSPLVWTYAVGSEVCTRVQRQLRRAQREDCNACFFETLEVAADSGPMHCGAVDQGSATPVHPQLRLLATQQRASLTSLTPRS